MNFSNIKHIIFDLGGVLINIDYNRTANAFKQLGFANFDAMYSQFKADELFEKLETGKVSDEDFCKVLIKTADKPVTDQQIITAWCAMLLDFRQESMQRVKALSSKYNLYLLSNTNHIHLAEVNRIFEGQFAGEKFNDNFIKAWYSNELGMRKPNKDIYEFVLQDAGLPVAETLFIDDTLINIDTAQAMGLQTYHLKPGEKIEDILPA